MTLTAKHRNSIYRTLAPLIGEEETEALLSEFPARDLDEPVTKEFLRAELADFRAEFAGLRGEFAGLRGEFAAHEGRINDRLRQQTIWMSGLMTTLVGVVALVS